MKLSVNLQLLFICLNFSQNIEKAEISLPDIVKLGKNWYEATAFVDFHKDITQAQAEQNAINNALAKIIEFHSGIEISSNSLSIVAETNLKIQTDHFSRLINTLSNGIILEKIIIESGIKKLIGNEIYEVKLKAKVGELMGEPDPLFKLKADLNREVYQDGDYIVINVNSSKDCFVYIFNILSDGNVSVLLPNEYIKENFLKAGNSITVPSNEEQDRGIKYKVSLLPDKLEDTEMIMVLGIKSHDKRKNDFALNLGNYKFALKELQYMLIDFPRDMIELENINYLIK